MFHVTIQARRQVEIVAVTATEEVHLLVDRGIDERNPALQPPVATEIRKMEQVCSLDSQSHPHAAHADDDQMDRPVALPCDRLAVQRRIFDPVIPIPATPLHQQFLGPLLVEVERVKVDLLAPLLGQVRNLESSISGLVLEKHRNRNARTIRFPAMDRHDLLQRIDVERIVVVLVRLADQKDLAGSGRAELCQLLGRIALGVQHQNTPLLPGIEHRVDAVAHLGGGLHALNQDIAIPVARVRADLPHEHRDHLVETDDHDVILKRIGNLALAIAFDTPLQHVRYHRDQQARDEQQSQNGHSQREPAQFGRDIGHAARIDEQADQLEQAPHRNIAAAGSMLRIGCRHIRRLREGEEPADQIDHTEKEQQDADQPGKLLAASTRKGPIEAQCKESFQ